MSVNKVNSDGSLSRVAGGTLYADAPIGAISPFGGSTVPSGYLLCDGAEVLKTAYAELYAVIGDAFGTASSNTKFVLPDLREATTKGIGLSGKSSAHYDADGVALGEFVEDRVQTHTHIYTGVHQSSTAYIPISGGSGMDTDDPESGITGKNTGRSGATTEVKAVGVNYIIKAKQVAVPFDVAEYIRNQNVLSDYEDISLSTNSANPTVFEYDGQFMFYTKASAGTGQDVYIKDNSGTYKQVARLEGGSGYAREAFSIPVKKGWSMYATGWANGVGQVAYYKLRDYSGR